MRSATATIVATFTALLPSVSPSEISGRPDCAAATATKLFGLEVAKAATVVAMIPAEALDQRASLTTPRTNSSPPTPAQATPMRGDKQGFMQSLAQKPKEQDRHARGHKRSDK